MLREWKSVEHAIKLQAGQVTLEGTLSIPDGATGVVMFVHGSGSSRHSLRNKFVASVLNNAELGTLLFDLLTQKEESIDIHTASLRFNIELLSMRVEAVTNWLVRNPQTSRLQVGYFGASTAVALVAASRLPHIVRAIVSRGGRPDLAGSVLQNVLAPTLLIAGQNDPVVIELNREALELLPASIEKSMITVPGATHLFEETGALEQVADLTCKWFRTHLSQADSHQP